jgi:DNA (cytosine-5)-methyltransferase 1
VRLPGPNIAEEAAQFVALEEGEIIVDSFAGGGGASVGIEMATGRSRTSRSITTRARLRSTLRTTRGPGTTSRTSGSVDPRKACAGRPVGLMWLSPDCTFFSKARGAKPFRDRKKARRRRGLANLAIRWAKAVKPRVS